MNVNGHELGARGGDNTVEKELDGENIDRGSSTISRIIYSISANGNPCYVGVLLLRSVIYNNPDVCHVLSTCDGDILCVYGKIVWAPSNDPDIPFSGQTNSFPCDFYQRSRYFGFFVGCLISIILPLSSSNTALSIYIGNLCLAQFADARLCCMTWVHDSIAS